jgi:hypothetical protein
VSVWCFLVINVCNQGENYEMPCIWLGLLPVVLPPSQNCQASETELYTVSYFLLSLTSHVEPRQYYCNIYVKLLKGEKNRTHFGNYERK